MWWWNNSSWTSWDYFWVGFIKTRELTSVLLTMTSHAFRRLWMDLIQTRYDNRYYCTLHFDTGLIDLVLQRSQGCAKAKPYAPVISQSMQSILMEFGIVFTFCTSYFTKFSIDLNGIWYTVQTSWWDEAHACVCTHTHARTMENCSSQVGYVLAILFRVKQCWPRLPMNWVTNSLGMSLTWSLQGSRDHYPRLLGREHKLRFSPWTHTFIAQTIKILTFMS